MKVKKSTILKGSIMKAPETAEEKLSQIFDKLYADTDCGSHTYIREDKIQIDEEKVLKICRSKKAKIKHISATGNIYYSYSPKKLARAIAEARPIK